MHLAGFEAELCRNNGLIRKKATNQTERKGQRLSSPMSSLPNLDSGMSKQDRVRLPNIDS
jgi:hypothetical protein